ncbi:MAG: cupin domain-containing protein [Prevotellaceae bacterium]|jgi:quercetin dioxygenase-like cupin family protein|nr:cupin domain-containing protein [Prevotellaceae bacterium]
MKTKSKNFNMNDEIAWEPAGNGMRRQIMGYDGQLMLVKVEFQKGAVGAVHEHFHSQASCVVSGKFEVQINGEKQALSPGDGFYVAPGVPHGAICLEAGVLIDTFSPVRLDFIKA